MEYILVQVRPTDCVTEEWPKDEQGSLRWATIIPGDRFTVGLDWRHAFPFAGLLDNVEEWLALNPGRWEMRVFRASRRDRCHRR